MRRLTFAEIEAARNTRGTTALLFITDRCPVGCAHCSVDSRRDSPKIRDYALFEQIVQALCESSFQLFGISGGEPFVERRGLGYATERFVASGKTVSIVTSGVWATEAEPPRWIRRVIGRCGSIVLSTDVFHAAALPDDRFIQAARTIAGEGVWIVAQVIDDEATAGRANELLERAFGRSWSDHAEIHRIPMLPHGRAASLFQPVATTRGRDFGPCYIARSPVIRYDGTISVCCNEAVIMGRGPEALRRRCRDGREITEAISALDRHAFFRAVADIGPGLLTIDPRLTDLAEPRYRSICDLCWPMVERVGDAADDALFRTASELVTGRVV
jgi:hypothetical protein